ncbi:hypothetical protein NLI96_g11298 [Meripilus lineatus]|uniref:C3H1-type domain-containing protein n=1 Tax=Meripilus lineatus TaxID=2056292 RepID=A0AAD5UW83_9APHY|nr:hypothetical protein NLI96_g11298 [Physisporinus lineatus]
MPVADSKQDDSSHDSSREERDKDKDRGDRNKQKASSGKTGASCPFSHAVLEPGQAKEICAWFVKGNCKFGHKCALAHVLPGQNMSMDRKNKKAAQAAANAANQNHSSGRDSHRGGRSRGNNHNSSQSAGNRNSLLSGSTAPTRSLSSSRGPMPMPLRSTLSPSAPAPPVKDTDFSSFGLPDESNKLPNAPAQAKSTSSVDLTDSSPPQETDVSPDPPKPQEQPQEASKSPPPLPLSTPRRNPQSDRSSPSVPDFGPIGSPPRASSSSRVSRSNGLSPGTSPHNAPLSSSPFSAPTTQTSFAIRDQLESANDFKAMSGLSASLGAMMSWDRKPASRLRNGNTLSGEVVVEDEDLEEFIPGSLSELLTPEERSRRLSRTASTRPSIAVADGDIPASQLQAGLQQGYSRSVPAPSLLQDIRSIWSDNAGGIPGSPDTSGHLAGPTITGGGLGNGTPSSFQSNSGFPSRLDEMLAPSNASAAFLPGLHHYINKPGARVAGAQSLYPTATSASGQHLSGAYSAGLGGMALSPPRVSSYTSRLDSGPTDPFLSQTRRPIPGSTDPFTSEQDERRSALSPSTRALQSHAPGQSLPQGLAAGYSRIHALPPLPSPSTPSAFSPGRNLVGFSPGTKTLGHVSSLSGEWHSVSPGAPNAADPATLSTSGNQAALVGLETMFSRLSYSAAASSENLHLSNTMAFTHPHLPSFSGPSGPPPGLVARNASGRSYNSGQPGPLSPLSRPVPTEDDDLFFSMDSMDG